jgi:Mg-chelatase subunit ChlD
MPLASRLRFLFSLGLLTLIILPASLMAQDAVRKGAFVAYQCVFQSDTNTAKINAVLMGGDGQPIPTGTYQVAVSAGDNPQALDSTKVKIERLDSRPPLQMILVLDITDTVPIEQIVNGISQHLFTGLNAQDRVALITFSEEIAPITQFYTDKDRLVADHMTNLVVLGGDNRLYDSLLQAAGSFPANSDGRKVIVTVTDSGRRKLVQASDEDIIKAANRDKIQIYPVGFYSRDRTDDAELQQLAQATGGFSWLYTETRNSRDSIGTAVSKFLDESIRTLNSEVLLTVNMQGQTPNSSGVVPLKIDVNTNNDSALSDTVNCPFQTLQHSISFDEGIDSTQLVTTSVDIGVKVQSDLSSDATKIVFRVNDEVAQSGSSSKYTFNAAEHNPGYYTIEAQLWDNNNATLATTPAKLRLYAQQKLALRVVGDVSVLSGSVQFEVSSNPKYALPAAQIMVASVSNPAQVFKLGDAVFQSDGKATLQVDNIQAVIDRLYPNRAATDTYQITAAVPGANSSDPKLAFSSPLTVSLPVSEQAVVTSPTEAVSAPANVPPIVPAVVDRISTINDTWVAPALIIGLLALNFILLRMIGRRRIMKLISTPDNIDLSPQLMNITLRRGDIKQSHTLTRKTVNVGRGSANDINLGDDPNISRQHGVIIWRKNNWWYSNRKKDTTTKVNGKKYRGLKLVKLEPVTEIEIGQTLMVFHSNAQQDVSDFIKTNL